jgi:acyl-[acyl carrier protein]--UDP-N-acetylglucosamine O-acyltransferase
MRRRGFVHHTVVVGEPAQDRASLGSGVGVLIDPTATMEAFVQVDSGTERPTTIGQESWLMKGVHVGHDAILHGWNELPPGCVVSGWVELGHAVRCGVGALFKPFVKVGAKARIGMGAVVICDVPPGEVWAGNPARRISTSPIFKGDDQWRETLGLLVPDGQEWAPIPSDEY